MAEKADDDITRLFAPPVPPVKWRDVIDYDRVRERLKAVVFAPLLHPELYDRTGTSATRPKPPSVVLLHGPRGAGKTYLMRALADATPMGPRVHFASMHSLCATPPSQVTNKGGLRLKRLFEACEEAAEPSVVFIDNLEHLSAQLKELATGTYETAKHVQTELIVKLNGICSPRYAGHVMVVAATHAPWKLDDWLLCRFDTFIYVPLPDVVTRMRAFLSYVEPWARELTPDDIEVLATATKGYSFDDVREVVTKTIHSLAQSVMEATHYVRMGSSRNGDGRVRTGWAPCSPTHPLAVECHWTEMSDEIHDIWSPPLTRARLFETCDLHKRVNSDGVIERHTKWCCRRVLNTTSEQSA